MSRPCVLLVFVVREFYFYGRYIVLTGRPNNVWGIPWVVGAKGQTPAFNEYCITNNYNFGTNIVFNMAANWPVDSWPGSNQSGAFMIPLFTNTVALPSSYWS
jgi:hypothetical protein